MQIGTHGHFIDNALIGGEIDKICFRYLQMVIWTVLASFRTRKLQISVRFGLVLDLVSVATKNGNQKTRNWSDITPIRETSEV